MPEAGVVNCCIALSVKTAILGIGQKCLTFNLEHQVLLPKSLENIYYSQCPMPNAQCPMPHAQF